jgi:hypothetical protein
MNDSITMLQAGQSKKMTETRLSFEELSITVPAKVATTCTADGHKQTTKAGTAL